MPTQWCQLYEDNLVLWTYPPVYFIRYDGRYVKLPTLKMAVRFLSRNLRAPPPWHVYSNISHLIVIHVPRRVKSDLFDRRSKLNSNTNCSKMTALQVETWALSFLHLSRNSWTAKGWKPWRFLPRERFLPSHRIFIGWLFMTSMWKKILWMNLVPKQFLDSFSCVGTQYLITIFENKVTKASIQGESLIGY